MKREIRYNLEDESQNIKNAVEDVKGWFGSNYENIKKGVVEALNEPDTDMNMEGIRMAFAMGGVEGYPVEAILKHWGVYDKVKQQ